MSAMFLGVCIGVASSLFMWGFVRNFVTAAHECGHVVAAIFMGGRITAITVRTDTSGVTSWFGERSRLRWGISAATGYPAPLIAAVAMAHTHNAGWEQYGLSAGAVLVAMSSPWWRGAWTIVVGAVIIAVLTAGAYFGGAVAAAVTGLVVGVGGVGGTRSVWEAVTRPAVRGDGSDVADVAAAFFVPISVSKAGIAVSTAALLLSLILAF